MFFDTLFGVSFKVTCASTSLQLYVFLQYLHYARSSTSPLIFFFNYYTKVLSYYGCTSTSPRSFAYRIGLGKVRGLVKGRGTSGSGMIFKMIKFVIFINTIVKVFNVLVTRIHF